MSKIKRICFLGGASWKPEDAVFMDAYNTAKLLGQNGYEIVNGGGPGVMLAATLGAHDGGAGVLAVTYQPSYEHVNYEGIDKNNKFDKEIVTSNYFDRTKIMLQNSDVHIVFKGGTGTISEFGMSWANSRIHAGHGKPLILFGEFWHNIVNELNRNMVMRESELDQVREIVSSPEEVLKFIKKLK